MKNEPKEKGSKEKGSNEQRFKRTLKIVNIIRGKI